MRENIKPPVGGDALHIEYLHMKEDDDRRHRKWCEYYCADNKCKKNVMCYGSSHCHDYKKRSDLNTENIGSFLKMGEVAPFIGLEYIDIALIKPIPFNAKLRGRIKSEVRKFKKFGDFSNPLYISVPKYEKNLYKIQAKEEIYFAAIKLNHPKILCIYEDSKYAAYADFFRKVGLKVNYRNNKISNKWNVGTVVKTSATRIYIELENGDTITKDFYTCINESLIKIYEDSH